MNNQIGRQNDFEWFDLKSVEGKKILGNAKAKKLLHGLNGMLLDVRLEKGVIVPEHCHSHESFCYLIEGQVKATIGGESFTIFAGDAFFHPKDVFHKAEILENSWWIEVKSPPEKTW